MKRPTKVSPKRYIKILNSNLYINVIKMQEYNEFDDCSKLTLTSLGFFDIK